MGDAKTKSEALRAFKDATQAIQSCTEKLRPHVDLYERYCRDYERAASRATDMRDPEVRALDAMVASLFGAALQFVRTFDEQQAVSIAARVVAGKDDRHGG